MTPGISVLIRTFNSARTLPDVLDRLKLQANDEVIIVDSGSTDATLEIAKKHQCRIIVAEKPFHYSRSLNLGFQAARQAWVLVMSSHCIPLTPDLLGTLRSAAATFAPNVAVAYGVCSLMEPVGPSDKPVTFANQDSPPDQRKSVYGGNGLALYRRVWWEGLPFDETVPTSEDLVWFTQTLARRAVAAHIPAACVLARNQGTLRHMFRKGVLESGMDRKITGAPGMTLLELGINWGALVKKCVLGRIPFGTLLRQSAHSLGVFLSPKDEPPATPTVQGKKGA